MKHKLYCLLIIGFCSVYGGLKGQVNLVPNGGFEIDTYCPNGVGGVYYGYAPPWDSPGGTPELFNACTPIDSSTSVPFNASGFQYAHSGNGYTNIISFVPSENNAREYIQVELDSALETQKAYCVSFFVNLSDSTGIGTNNIGMYFSSTHTLNGGFNYLHFTPQINDTNIISDTLNWTEISGTYIAQGGERYIIIGNFYPDSLTDTVAILTTRHWNSRSGYYYVDDVSVFEIKDTHIVKDTIICHNDSASIGKPNYEGITYSLQPTAGLSNAAISNPRASPLINTTYYLTETSACNVIVDTFRVSLGICYAGINELKRNESITIAPNPFSTQTTITFSEEQKNTTIKVINVLGEVIQQLTTNNKQLTLDLSGVAKGIYFVRITSAGSTSSPTEATDVVNRKIVVE